MCGIAGFISDERRWDENNLKQATISLTHRGPDAQGVWYDAGLGVGLGHRRLSIIDLSEAANQPMWSHNKRYVAIFNGEVFNYKEIAKELGIAFNTTSDTEVLIEAFSHWGPNFVTHCNGFFAMAIYDTHENALWLFRDRMGLKPLYYYWNNGSFAFGSEIKIFNFLGIQKSIYQDALDSFLHLGYIPAPNSIYQEIKKLPKGKYARIENKNLVIQTYWTPEEKISAVTLKSEDDAKSRLNELLRTSVEYRMISDVPLGTFLSGGVDSSLVTAVAQSISESPINTFSIGFDFATHDESRFAEAVAKKLKTNHHTFRVTQKDALDWIAQIPNMFDEPFADPSAIPTTLVSKLARKHVTVALSGDGGDELFWGYGMYAWAERLNNPAIQFFKKPIHHLLKSSSSNKYKAASTLFDFNADSHLQSHIFSQEQRFFSTAEVAALVNRPSHFLFNLNENHLNRKLTAIENQSLFDLNNYLPDDLLVKVDRASMRHGLEVRVPLLDYRIVEFALNLAPSLKIHQGVTKYLLKQVLYSYLPQELFQRPKWGFSIPLINWLQGDLKYLLDEILKPAEVDSCGLVKSEIVSKYINRFRKGEHYLFNRLWTLAMLHLWYKKIYV